MPRENIYIFLLLSTGTVITPDGVKDEQDVQ